MRKTYVIDLTGKTKDAAIYFDWVVPLSFGIDPKSRFIQCISPATLYTSAQAAQPCKDYIQAIEALRAAAYYRLLNYPADDQHTSQEAFAQKAIRMIQARPELHDAHFLLPDDDPFPGVDTDSGFRVSLIGLSLIDTDEASWDQIIEFRKDKKSQMALRRLRIFFDKEYAGKSRHFIENDILMRLEAYNKCGS